MKKTIVITKNAARKEELYRKMLAEGKFPDGLAEEYGFHDHVELARYAKSVGHPFENFIGDLRSLYGILGVRGLTEGDLREIWEVA